MEIYLKVYNDFRNGLITDKEVREMTKEVDKAMSEARKELKAMKKSGEKRRLEFFDYEE